MDIPALELTGLRKQYGTVTAVAGIDLRVEPGEIVAFLGPNGAGKTTTLDMVLGLTSPTAGTVLVGGETPRQAIRAGGVSALLQTGGLLHDLTVGETIDYIAAAYRGGTIGRRALDLAGIGNLAGRKVSKCSGGEQQRLKFALALLPDPSLLILDEPTTGLDVSARRSFWETMRGRASEGRTIIFATHYLEEADQFAERVVLISQGHIVADGSVDEVRSFTGARRVAVSAADPDRVRRALAASYPDLAVTGEDRLAMTSANSDDLARFLLGLDGVTDLEIASPSLEDAFVNLTVEGRAA